MRKIVLVVLSVLCLMNCKKKETEAAEEISDNESIAFVITCDDCSITYSENNGSSIAVNNIKTSFRKDYANSVDLKINVTLKKSTSLSFYRNSAMVVSKTYSSNFSISYSRSTGILSDGSATYGSGSSSGGSCGSHNGKSLNRGPEGGCYYINSNGNKTYVNRSECKC